MTDVPAEFLNKWPAANLEWRPIADLIPYAQNPRIHSDAQVQKIAASVREYGWTIPVLIDERGELIAGHGRILAAPANGIEVAPVLVARGWSEEQKRAYRIADNQLTLAGEWDFGLLHAELGKLKIEDFDLKFTGFDDGELNKLLGYDGQADPDKTPAVEERAVSRTGDLWLLGGESGHRLLAGDCTKAEDVARAMGRTKPHLMVTDPPYGVDYDPDWRDRHLGGKRGGRATGQVKNDGKFDWHEAWALFSGDVVYCWTSGRFIAESLISIEASGFERRALIVWAKSHHTMGRGHYHSQEEECWYAVRKGATGSWQGDRSQTTLWQIDKPVKSETGHSTQKPVECMKRPIENNSRAGDAVYDPFIGSGTTIIAAEMTGRHCIALEVAPQYIDVSVRRWQQFSGKTAVLEGDGRTFDEIAAERADGRDSADPEKVVHPPRPAGSGLFE